MPVTTMRIAPLPADDETAGSALGRVPGREGPPLNIFRTLARHPDLFRAFARLGGYLLRDGTLPARERELVILRVGWRSGSEYEFGQHTVIGRGAGLTDEEIARLAVEGTAGWSDDDAALLRLADELCAADVVSDVTWTALTSRWDEPALLELLVLAGYYRLVSGMLNSAGVPLEPTTPGWPAGADAGVRRAPREEQA
jgi:alkylhydroperoxidase family enzyme